ncbi:HNH endonuclease [Crossiella sp. SN42]|uniref:HNH endonuclease signature motif containing protein n=1 Tax=Crossiella sp. SN42 TaxID=2944808 RepID=UPI00207D1EA5|nr:HNH endonuclease signature motif containing protein [Crossiella sp. SN42]MCO1575349.1 HNH endonuclease [Crossiella sp. SN42]
MTAAPRGSGGRPSWEGSDRRGRLPPDWPARRARVLHRDPVCRLCLDALATEVDHISPGDDHDETNLHGVCQPCHRRKSSTEGATARRELGQYVSTRRPPPPHPGLR